MTEYIDIANLKDGHIYRLHSRNMAVGVWCAETSGFIGVRTKFGSKFLFTEYEYTTHSMYGTARALTHLGEVPRGTPLKESLGLFCKKCGDRTFKVWVDDPSFSSRQRCVGDKHYVNYKCDLEGTFCAEYRENLALFEALSKALDTLEDKYIKLVTPPSSEG